MNLHTMLAERGAAGRPLRVALVGAGKFGTMWLAQAVRDIVASTIWTAIDGHHRKSLFT